MNSISIKFIKGKSAVFETRALRLEVFEQEQGFVDEFDEFDEASTHVIIQLDEQVIASGRMYEEGTGVYHLGRIVVKKTYRSLGFGKEVVRQLVDFARTLNATQCVLSSQSHACQFYERCGFKKDGPIIYDQNQPHQMMIYNI